MMTGIYDYPNDLNDPNNPDDQNDQNDQKESNNLNDLMTGSFADDWPYGIFYFTRRVGGVGYVTWLLFSDIWLVDDLADEFRRLEFLILALLLHIFPWLGDWKWEHYYNLFLEVCNKEENSDHLGFPRIGADSVNGLLFPQTQAAEVGC